MLNLPAVATIALLLVHWLAAVPALAADRIADRVADPALTSALLEVQGFKCEAPSAVTGTTCVGTVDGYPREVAIVVPPGFLVRDRADVILHLHGFNLDNHPLSYMLSYFHFAQALAATHRNAVLVAPLSYGQCDDFNQSLADSAAHYRAFIDKVEAILQGSSLVHVAEPASITLTGHSGAYFPLSEIIGNGVYADRTQELYLLDATYGGADAFERFAALPHHRFWSAYHSWDQNMEAVNTEIMRDLSQEAVPFYVSPKPIVPPQEVGTRGVGFVVSDVDHDSTFFKYFQMLLSVSR